MRALNTVEQAFTVINEFYPFTPVCIIRIEKGPSPHHLRLTLDRLQQFHPLLSSIVREYKGRYWFEKDTEGRPVSLQVIKRIDENHWYDAAREELNKGFNPGKGPLMKVIYLSPDSDNGNAEIILSFHHAIVDAASLLYIIKQMLTLAGNDEAIEEKISTEQSSVLTHSPVLKNILPKSFRMPGLIFRMVPFLFRQFNDELKYRITLRQVTDIAIPPSSENNFLVTTFTQEETLNLVKWSRSRKLTMNSIIVASMLHAVNRHTYSGKKKLLRTVQFSNLRPYLKPPVNETSGGCFATMMRFSVDLSPTYNIAETAAQIDQQFIKSAKRGDKFLYAILSKILVKNTVRAHNARLGATALSYVGALSLKQNYGSIRVNDIHCLITNNSLGAELSGFAKICFGRLSLDLNFLTYETSLEKAKLLTGEIKSGLLKMISD